MNLLRQVLSRILRHNIRNKLVTIQGNAADIRRDSDDAFARERSEWIDEASDSLLAITEKARTVEDIVAGADEEVVVDLRTVARAAIAEYEAAYPDVTFRDAGLAECRVRAVPGLETAVSYLVENAAKYNDAADPTVTVRVADDDGKPTLAVVDNGPGIPDHEIEVLAESRETALSHSDGLGLWLVKWTANASGATLSFDTGDDGTTARIRFDAAATVSE